MSTEEVKQISVQYGSPGWEAALFEVMDIHGAVLVLGAFSQSELDSARAAFGRDLKRALAAWQPDDSQVSSKTASQEVPAECMTMRKQLLELDDGSVPASWPPATPLGPPGKGMATTFGLAQGEFAWTMRLSDQMRGVFALLHECAPEEMCVGTDQPFFTAADIGPDGQPLGRSENAFWMHADQNKHAGVSGILPSYQGVAYVSGSDSDTASTTVLQLRSHNDGTYDTLMEDPTMKSCKGHFGKVEAMVEGEAKDAIVRCAHKNARRVPAPAGSILLWNSKVLHQGWQGGSRLAMPVVWEPRDRRDSKALARKLAAVVAGVPTTHWASLGLWHPMVRLGRQKIPQPECIPHQPRSTVLPAAIPTSWALQQSLHSSGSLASTHSAGDAAGASSASPMASGAGGAHRLDQKAAEYIATVACNAAKKVSPVHLRRLQAALACFSAGGSTDSIVAAGKAISGKAQEDKGHTLAKASREVADLLKTVIQADIADAL